MAANDGPIPVRTLAHAARLIRGARELKRYGITTNEVRLDYSGLLRRVREVVKDVRDHSSLRAQAERLGVSIHERVGMVRFADAHTVEAESGLRLHADRFILCAGGRSRRLQVPGSEWTATHSDAWSLTAVPASMMVIGGGMTGLQVASIFHAFGSSVQVFQRGARILPDEDEDVSIAVAAELRAMGIDVREGFGNIEAFEKTAAGIRMIFSKDGRREIVEAALAVVAIGWVAAAASLNLHAAGVGIDERGFVKVDEFLRTAAPHIYAAGDITGRSFLVPPAVLDAHVAATNAVGGAMMTRSENVIPMGGFTDPEYARVGITEAEARRRNDIRVGVVRFDETARTIIDGRTTGFCKVIADRRTKRILGCHVVGERAADIVQAVAIAIRGDLGVDDLARLSLAFPTYVGIVSRAAYRAARAIDSGFISSARIEEP
jgi:dihydrolipoamide dehydrogenase